MPTKEPLLKRVAIASGVSYQYARQVVSQRLNGTRAQKRVLMVYTEMMQEEVDNIRQSIIHEAINDFN